MLREPKLLWEKLASPYCKCTFLLSHYFFWIWLIDFISFHNTKGEPCQIRKGTMKSSILFPTAVGQVPPGSPRQRHEIGAAGLTCNLSSATGRPVSKHGSSIELSIRPSMGESGVTIPIHPSPLSNHIQLSE